ncbi:MAG: hypothetical protein WCK31_04435 [bacterium]
MKDQSPTQETGTKNVSDRLKNKIGYIVLSAATVVVTALGVTAMEGQSRTNESKLETGDSNPNKNALNYSKVTDNQNTFQVSETVTPTAVTPEATPNTESLVVELPENSVYQIQPTNYLTGTEIEDGDIITANEKTIINAKFPIGASHTYTLTFSDSGPAQAGITENGKNIDVKFTNNRLNVSELAKTLLKFFEVKENQVRLFLKTHKINKADSSIRVDFYAANVSSEGICTSAMATVAPTPTATGTATPTGTATVTATRGIDTATPTQFVPTETATQPPVPTKTRTPNPTSTPKPSDTPRPTDTPSPTDTPVVVKQPPATPVSIIVTAEVRP